MNFNDYFYYDETSPSYLRWKITTRNYKHKAGDVAGNLHQDHDYYRVGLNFKLYEIHRIVFEVFYKRKIHEGKHIDHIDGNTSNNEISNLREVNSQQNHRNRKKNKSNTTGTVGVTQHTKKSKDKVYNYWRAKANSLYGESLDKLFSIETYGEEGAFKLACDCRDNFITDLNAQGAGYTEDHGKRILEVIV